MLTPQPNVSSPSTREAAASSRLLSLDVLRGLTIAGMILVTNPGTYQHIFPQLRQALWNGPTAADLIFPCFLVMVGISMTLSFAARLERGDSPRALTRHALRRSLVLVVLGLLVNGFPFFRFATMRLPGILQRIGICYAVVALLYLALSRPAITKRTRQSALGLACFGVLTAYWLLLKLYPTPGFGPGRLDPLGSLPAVLDRALFTVPHLFQYGVKTPGFGITFDPEGVLSTLGALGTTLLGVLAGEELRSPGSRRRQGATLATAGTALWLLSLVLSRFMPLNKQIDTPTFALWSGGLSLVVFAGLFYLIDIRQLRRGWTLALILGTNAIFAFLLSQLLTDVLLLVRVSTATGRQALYEALNAWIFAPWLPPRTASLAYAVTLVLLNAALVYPLYRRRLFLRL